MLYLLLAMDIKLLPTYKAIIWLMYVTLCILDYFQTVALIDAGYTEANPIVVWIVDQSGDWEYLLYIKIFWLSVLGILLAVKGSENKHLT